MTSAMAVIGLCGFALAGQPAALSSGLDLPDPLVTASGEPVDSPEVWREVRRPELLELFRTHIYGRAPIGRPADESFAVQEVDAQAMGGAATRKDVRIRYSGRGGEGGLRLTLFVPNERPAPAPGFVLICNRDPENIDPARQTKSPFWPAEQIVDRGYFAAAFHYADIDHDDGDDRFDNGVHALFDPPRAEGPSARKEQPRPGDAWGAIAAWAWGASRALDYLETDPDIDATRVAVVGHSRGGKAALWAGARDKRFAMTVSNNSGCTGAALARREQGERVADILRFKNWFCTNYRDYAGREQALPVDQHQLLALVAPRLLYVASASDDDWADPEGEYLAAVHASPVWGLHGQPGLVSDAFPAPGESRHEGRIGYHLREGGHNLTEEDWSHYMDFADRWMQPVE
ncbi:prolyl oligopeptidase family serine peptidase [Botrimarina sp.]|uniref:glucuronyl esterase domain-containing protein n=1 Tax=Botrimarina sp. TaxID=2795802 RepID=UPI0032EDB667